MKKIVLCVIFGTLMLSITLAQDSRLRLGDPLPGGTGELFITPMPGQIPGSLKELCDSSTLIIDGTVKATLPSRELNPRSLETDAVIVINSTLKGSATSPQIVISQPGGSKGELTAIPAQYSLVQPGERYILFLTEDKRPKIPEVAGVKRYLPTGIWSGLFRFEEGRMRVSARRPDPLRKRYEGLTLDQVTREIETLLRP